jgi:hypothetical protein
MLDTHNVWNHMPSVSFRLKARRSALSSPATSDQISIADHDFARTPFRFFGR